MQGRSVPRPLRQGIRCVRKQHYILRVSVGGELPTRLKLYPTPRFETSHEKYQWLNRIQVVGRGSVEPEGDRFKVTYSWYALAG